MILEIENFKCYEQKKIYIIDNKMTLISGASGIGKTSILQAIYWCLYGKLRGVYRSENSKKCSVQLTYGNIVINRQGRPNLLRLIDQNGTIYEDTIAQQIIDNWIGSKEMWVASSYLAQNNISVLLSGSNVERMNLLNNMAFVHDDPSQYISRIDDELKTQQKSFVIAQTQYTTECNLLQGQMNQEKHIFQYRYSEEIIKAKKEELTQENQNYTQLKQQKDAQNNYVGQIQSMENMINGLRSSRDQSLNLQRILGYDSNNSKIEENKKKLGKIDQAITDNEQKIETLNNLRQTEKKHQDQYHDLLRQIRHLEEDQEKNKQVRQFHLSQIEKLNREKDLVMEKSDQWKPQYDLLCQKKDKMNKELEKAKLSIPNNHNLNTKTYQDFLQVSEQEKKYRLMNDKCQQLGISIHQIEVTKKKMQERYQYLLDVKKNNQIRSQISGLEQERNKIHDQWNLLHHREGEIQEEKDNSIEDRRRKYHEMISGRNIHSCPHCGESVRIVSGKVEKSSIPHASEEEIQQSKVLLDQAEAEFNAKKQLNDKLTQLDQKISSLRQLITTDYLPSPDQELQSLNQKIRLCHEIQIVELPSVSSVDIQNSLNLRKQQQDIHSLHNEIENLLQRKKEMDIQLEDLISKINEMEKLGMDKTPMDSDEKQKALVLLRQQAEIKQKELLQIQSQVNESNTQYQKNKLDLETEKKKLEEEMKMEKEKKTQYDRYETELVKFQEQMSELEVKIKELRDKIDPELNQKIENSANKIRQVDYEIKCALRCQEYQILLNQLEKKKIDMMEKQKSLTSLGDLRQSSVDLECKQLQSTVDAINSMLEAILDSIFDSPIKVIIKLYKKLKSNKRIKPSVNLTINYKGMEYDNPNFLSGGEMDRISMAITIALNKISNSPFLLLDESMKSINNDLRSSVVESMKSILSNEKTILCINHEDTEGHYDHYIKL